MFYVCKCGGQFVKKFDTCPDCGLVGMIKEAVLKGQVAKKTEVKPVKVKVASKKKKK